jgi:hyaluronate lyase
MTGIRSGLLLLLLPFVCLAGDMDDLRLRWRDTLVGGSNLNTSLVQVRSRLTSIQTTGRNNWTSLQKAADRPSLWTDIARTNISADISSNYGRLRDMTVAWATPGQALYQDAGLLADILAGLDWMDAHRYNAKSIEYDNWWDWEIGTPAILVDTAILLYDQLSPDRLARYLAAVERFDSNPSIMIVNTVSTGANLADKCKIALLRGVLVKDAAKITMAVKALTPVFAYVASGDGFYVDGSFIQHTRHPYTGSYGLVLLGDIANLLYLLAGSPWDVTDPARANVTFWQTDGFAPLLYKGAMMDMVRGRAISRNSSPDHAIGHSTIASLLRITQFAPDDEAAALRSAIKRWLIDDTSRDYSSNLPLDLIGEARRILDDESIASADPPSSSRVYASMDRVLHLRPTWAAGIAMHSTRIYNYESINNENLKAWHTGDGMTYLYNDDLLQFADTFWPTVDVQRLPGTTVVAGSTARQSQLGGSNAVGGTSLDGYSAAMMQLSPDGRQLSAKKSWFLFDDELVALGADIRATAAGKTVETIVENRRVPASATFASDPSGAWANLAGSIGYYFPGNSAWQSLRDTRTGAWSDINAGGPVAKLSAQYQTLWFDHGVMPAGAAYSYVLLPGKSADDTAAYAAAPAVQIVQNDAVAQAVTHSGLGIQAANFWAPVARPVAGITADAIASVMVHQSEGIINIAVTDPTQANNGTVHVEIGVAAESVISQDAGVTVDQMSPTVRLSINVRGARGKTFRAGLGLQ